jgi:hypothetical protein
MARRSLLFVTSYAPLATMFVAILWPAGWSTNDLALASVLLAAVVTVIIAGGSSLFFTKGRRRNTLRLVAIAASVVVVVGLIQHWYRPLAWHPPQHHTRGTIMGIALGAAIAGFEMALVIFYSGRQTSRLQLIVRDPRDQGPAVAGYMATYLLPLLTATVPGWRGAVAYTIYFSTLYVIFVRSEGLVLINPSLYLLGYRIYDVELDPPRPAAGQPDETLRRRVLVLVRDRISRNATLDVVDLGDDCYLSVR